MASLQGAEQHVSLGKTVPIVNRYHAPVSTTTLYDELDHYASKHTQGLTLIHTLDVTVTHSKTDAYPYFGRRVLPYSKIDAYPYFGRRILPYSKIDDPLLFSLDVTIAHLVVHPTTQPENSWFRRQAPHTLQGKHPTPQARKLVVLTTPHTNKQSGDSACIY